jgi:hypothetical protein
MAAPLGYPYPLFPTFDAFALHPWAFLLVAWLQSQYPLRTDDTGGQVGFIIELSKYDKQGSAKAQVDVAQSCMS